jgi:hypothetical protein
MNVLQVIQGRIGPSHFSTRCANRESRKKGPRAIAGVRETHGEGGKVGATRHNSWGEASGDKPSVRLLVGPSAA